jgi:hypothetical protein
VVSITTAWENSALALRQRMLNRDVIIKRKSWAINAPQNLYTEIYLSTLNENIILIAFISCNTHLKESHLSYEGFGDTASHVMSPRELKYIFFRPLGLPVCVTGGGYFSRYRDGWPATVWTVRVRFSALQDFLLLVAS